MRTLNLDPPPDGGGFCFVLSLLRYRFSVGCLLPIGPVPLRLLGGSWLGRCRRRCAFCGFRMLLDGKPQQCPQVGRPVGKVPSGDRRPEPERPFGGALVAGKPERVGDFTITTVSQHQRLTYWQQ